MRYITIIAIAIAMVFISCKGKEEKAIYSTPKGKVEVSESEEGRVKEMKITSEEGTAVFKSTEGVIPEDIGVPLYPGATAKEGGTFSISGEQEGKSGGFSLTYLFTEDNIDKVIAYYKKELSNLNPGYYEMTTPNGKNATFVIGEDTSEKTTIVLSQRSGDKGTNIQITKVREEE